MLTHLVRAVCYSRSMRFLVAFVCLAAAAQDPRQVEQWTPFEVSLRGPDSGNPFVEVSFGAEFRQGHRAVFAGGFYDGGGTYRVRFMPDAPGQWTYRTRANRPELDAKTGRFVCTPARAGNHGPVTVRETWHFGFADGTPYYPVGTTAYAWIHQGDELEEQTLATLRGSPFNKIRMCVFPKDYVYNRNDPPRLPFAGRDFTRFNPEFFQHLEKRVRQLMDAGIEADLILFHPYDRWGYSKMPAEADGRYLRYTVARLAAFRNVWWSMANEWDFMKEKKLSDFDRFFRIVQESDPYQHLRGIHNGAVIYDHAKPWVTHASIQSADFEKTGEWLRAYNKPVVFDECQYEGNIPRRWGNISAHEMVRRFWQGTARGAYVGHGETYLHPREILWWSKGGVLHGESPKRIAFLRRIIEESGGLNPLPAQKYPAAFRAGECYLFYFDSHQPAEMEFDLPAPMRAEVIDTWEMTVTPLAGTYSGKFTLKLPGKPWQAVRFRK
ncbi:MAG: DUF5060 domain-containing protein [Bryobacteraceae bacterium]